MYLLIDAGIVIGSYIIGSVPFGLVVVKLMTGKDVRTIASGRTGLCQPRPSTSQANMAKTTKSKPAMKRQKESVHSFLLMGSQ